FFFQAEDGIRDRNVTGVQTCALPICPLALAQVVPCRLPGEGWIAEHPEHVVAQLERFADRQAERCARLQPGLLCPGHRRTQAEEIGRASCRERGEITDTARAA